jgi:hypothetical protein
MLRILRQHDDTFLLRAADDRHVGWVRAGTIHFDGFASTLDVVAAAIGGGNALAAYLGGTTVLGHGEDAFQADRSSVVPAVGDPLRHPARLSHDGTHEWVLLGGRRIARLVTPTSWQRGSDGSLRAPDGHGTTAGEDQRGGELAIEFVLPEGVSVDACLTLAQVLYAAVSLHRCGNPPATRPPRGQRTDAAATSAGPSQVGDGAIPSTV